jgi:hypothetical protein
VNFSALRYFGHRALRPLGKSGEPRALPEQQKPPMGLAAANEGEAEIAGIMRRSDKAAGKSLVTTARARASSVPTTKSWMAASAN